MLEGLPGTLALKPYSVVYLSKQGFEFPVLKEDHRGTVDAQVALSGPGPPAGVAPVVHL